MATTWITMITGEVGSGKTMRQVLYIVDRLCQGGPVYTNIRLKTDAVDLFVGAGVIDWTNYHYIEMCDVRSIYSDVGRSVNFNETVLLVLDEVAEWFDAYEDGGSNEIKQFCSALRHTRKLGVEIRIITQHRDLLQRRIRMLVQREIACFDGRTFRFGPLGFPLLPPYCFMLGAAELDKEGKMRRGKRHYMLPQKVFWGLYETRESYCRVGGEVQSWKKGKKMSKSQIRLMWAAILLAMSGNVLSIHAIRAASSGHGADVIAEKSAFPFAAPGGHSTASVASGGALLPSSSSGGVKAAPDAPTGFGAAISSRGAWVLKNGKIIKLPFRKG